MNAQELKSLREAILSDIVPLVLESSGDGSDRFSLLLRIIQAGNASADIYKQAYESAKKIEGVEDRLEALLSLLDEVDFDAGQSEISQADNDNDAATAASETSSQTQAVYTEQ